MPHRHDGGLLLSTGHGLMHGKHLRMIMARCRISRSRERRIPESKARKKPYKRGIMPPLVRVLRYELSCRHGCFTGSFMGTQDMTLLICRLSGNFPGCRDGRPETHLFRRNRRGVICSDAWRFPVIPLDIDQGRLRDAALREL